MDEFEAQVLLSNREKAVQDEVNKGYSEFQDLIVSESLRNNFTIWLNSKLEEFFKISKLLKEGSDLSDDNPSLDKKPVNNIGFISINIRRSLYNETKKNISLYSPIDFAIAKERVIEKLDYWLNQYGRKEEDEL